MLGIPDIIQSVPALARGPDLPGRVRRFRLPVRAQQLVGAVQVEAGGREVSVHLLCRLCVEVPTNDKGNLGSLGDVLQVLEKVTALS